MLIFLIGSPVLGAETQPVSIHITDQYFANTFQQTTIHYWITQDDKIITEEQTITSEKGTFIIQLPEGSYTIELATTQPNLETYDNYGRSRIYVSKTNTNATIPLAPIGSVEVQTITGNGKQLEDVLINTDCKRRYGSQENVWTNQFGKVTNQFLPVTNCTIRAGYEDYVLTKNITIKKGIKQEITFKFSEIKKSYNNLLLLLLIIVASILIIIIIKIRSIGRFLNRQEQTVKQDKNKEAKLKNINITQTNKQQNTSQTTINDLLTVLNKKEQVVTKFLITELHDSNIPKEKFFRNQSNIIYGAGIPKTSLSRIFASLEEKKIIRIEKIGKAKRIYFHEFFLKKL